MHPDMSERHVEGEVLIVEDTAASLKLLGELLVGAGYQVRLAANGESALRAALSRPPDLILLNIHMPGLDGFEVCRRLKAVPALRHVPVIFLSARHGTHDRVRGFELGGVDFIARPFRGEEILSRTDTHLRLGRAQQALASERARLEQRVHVRTAELEKLAATLAGEVRARRASEEFLRLAAQVFEATLDAIIITDPAGRIVTSNPAFSRISGYAAQDVAGWDATRLGAASQDPLFRRMRQGLHSSGHWSGEVLSRRKSGATHPGFLSVSPVLGPDGQVSNFVGVFTDITERKADQGLIDFLSHHDALTGLPNRRLARELFEQARATARREGKLVAVLCLNLDRFKNVNDAFGSAVGDKALQVVALFLSSCVRDSDIVSRQGGDEFQLILHDDTRCGATLATAQKILAGLRDDLLIDGQHILLTTSIGIALCPNDGNDLDELVRNADTALLRAKEMGRDNYAFFTERMEIELREKLTIQNQLRGAIARNEFEVHYQPQVSLQTGALQGAEALLRWDNALLGQVPPSRFIPLAEECGLITAIGEWVLDAVCAQIKAWQDEGLGDIKVAVNVSGSQFAQHSTVQFVEDTLRKNGITAACLGLEITEGTVMGDPNLAVAALKRLKDIGVGISLDDFGTGYSSLSYLKRFPIDVLKIDKSFVDDVSRNRNDAAIALSVISLAHNLNMRVIAEGVETREQVDFLKRHGCDEMQGYYFSRAVAADAFTALLSEQRPLPVK